MGPAVRTLTLAMAAATLTKVLLAVADTDDIGSRFFDYTLGAPLQVPGLQAIRDETLAGQRLQVFRGRQRVDGIPVGASFLVLNGRIASIGLEVQPADAGRLRDCLEMRLGKAHAVTRAQGHPYLTWSYGDLSVGFGFRPEDRRYLATANLGDMRHFRPQARRE